MLQQDTAEDFVIATGVTTSVRDFVILAFRHAGIELVFEGSGINEIGKVKSIKSSDAKVAVGQIVVQVDKNYFRPTEVDLLIGDASKAKEKLGWQAKTSLNDLTKEMVDYDLSFFKATGRANLGLPI
jgi:GDPmannose 4,6-dehydratase